MCWLNCLEHSYSGIGTLRLFQNSKKLTHARLAAGRKQSHHVEELTSYAVFYWLRWFIESHRVELASHVVCGWFVQLFKVFTLV